MPRWLHSFFLFLFLVKNVQVAWSRRKQFKNLSHPIQEPQSLILKSFKLLAVHFASSPADWCPPLLPTQPQSLSPSSAASPLKVDPLKPLLSLIFTPNLLQNLVSIINVCFLKQNPWLRWIGCVLSLIFMDFFPLAIFFWFRCFFLRLRSGGWFVFDSVFLPGFCIFIFCFGAINLFAIYMQWTKRMILLWLSL